MHFGRNGKQRQSGLFVEALGVDGSLVTGFEALR